MLPIAAVVGVGANSFRLAEIIKIPALWCVLVLLNLAFMLFIVKLLPRANQRLIIDDIGLTWRRGKLSIHRMWQDVSAIRLIAIDYRNRDKSLGTTIECSDGQSINLNASWTIPRRQLVQLIADRCKAATGKHPRVIDQDPEAQ